MTSQVTLNACGVGFDLQAQDRSATVPAVTKHMRRDGEPFWVDGDVVTPIRQLLLGGGEDGVQESWLQDQLFKAPSCIPVETIERGITAPLRSVCCELPTAHGPIDNLFMTSQGDIVIAEVKLWRNPEARRKVVAQALDYASCLFQMSYSDFEKAALAGNLGTTKKPKSLYELVAAPDVSGGEAMNEPQFIDQVTRNLKRGNIVVLVVGDGIREATEQLAATLQTHATLRFTFALVEMSIYRLEGRSGYLLLPRTLARTQMIDRGVFSIVEGRAVQIQPPSSTVSEPRPVGAGGITEDQFFAELRSSRPDAVEKVRQLIELLQPLGVEPEFLRALNLKVETKYGTRLNLLTIQRDGQTYTETANYPRLQPMGEAYQRAVAEALGCEVRPNEKGTKLWMRLGDEWPSLDDVIDRLAGIVEPAREFIRAIEARDAALQDVKDT